jgi:polyphosphate kinase 2 (PPK2 family)
MTDQFSAEINQLQQQQALFTQALQSMLEGKWAAGPDTVEAFLYALNPTATGNVTLDVPVTQSEYSQPPLG